MKIKRIAKRGLQNITSRIGPHRFSSANHRLLILMYHRVLPALDKRMQDEEPGMAVTPESFALHMQLLQKHFHIVQLSDWLQRRKAGLALPKRACVISFDDGWLDNYQFAFPLLQRQQLPATIFLVSTMVGTLRNFWPERLAELLRLTAQRKPELWNTQPYQWLRELRTDYAFGDTPPSQQQLFEIFKHAKNQSDQQLHERIDAMQSSSDVLQKPGTAVLNWEQVAEMSDSGLIEFGSHTCDHIRLNENIERQAIEHQIVTSKEAIAAATHKPVELFCYPNGDFNETALAITRQHYVGAVTTNKGWNSMATDAHLLNRIGVHEDISADKTAFLARLSGWL